MSKNIIDKKDMDVLEMLQKFLMNFVITPDQELFLENNLNAKVSPAWDGRIVGLYPAQRRLHDINNAIRGEETKYHVAGLTVTELLQIAITLGIARSEVKTNKESLWGQIKRRLNPNLSRAEAQIILYAVLETLTDEEIKWLKEYRQVSWKSYYKDDQDWINSKATTVTDCSMRVMDILHSMENHMGFDGCCGRVRKDHLILLGNRLEILPICAVNFPKGTIKAIMLKGLKN
ncbi:MAG: hypothetical protein KAI29_25680 [Cyclobacteriaceae bacterium]|nr:hypothetical protein [Candidatus Paceibacterota bacterium]MCK5704579.1 hypothetical protein [Cyclobacteriaceae bacterium]